MTTGTAAWRDPATSLSLGNLRILYIVFILSTVLPPRGEVRCQGGPAVSKSERFRRLARSAPQDARRGERREETFPLPNLPLGAPGHRRRIAVPSPTPFPRRRSSDRVRLFVATTSPPRGRPARRCGYLLAGDRRAALACAYLCQGERGGGEVTNGDSAARDAASPRLTGRSRRIPRGTLRRSSRPVLEIGSIRARK